MDSVPDSVDDDGDGGLGNPRNGFGDDGVNPIEDVPAVSEAILDESVPCNLRLNAIVPGLNSRVCTEPNGLSAFNIADRPSGVSRHSSGLASVVSSVYESFSELSKGLERSSPVEIFGMAFTEFLQGRDVGVLKNVGVHQVDIDPHTEGGFEHRVVGFPDDYL